MARVEGKMDERDFDNIRYAGSEAARKVGEALSQIDFSGISESIEKAARDVGQQISAFGRNKRSPYVINDRQAANRAQWQMWAGLALIVFLALPLVSIGLSLFFMGLVPRAIIIGIGFVAGVAAVRLVGHGSREKVFVQALRRIDKAVGDRQSISIAELAGNAGIAVPRLVSVLDEAISRGLIPEGHLDADGDGKRTLFLTDEAWGAAQGGRRSMQAPSPASAEAEADSPAMPEEAREVLAAATQSAEKIRGCASKIREEEVCGTLERIASKSENICAYIMHHPEVAVQFRRAVTYYLPTTAKFAASYAELEGRATGPEVVKVLSDLRASFAQIDEALSKLSDELVLDQSIDVHSDIEVLRTMLEQDGLSV